MALSELDRTQLAKISINISRCSDGNFNVKTFKSETPPPSPQPYGDAENTRPPHSYVRLVIMALLERPGKQGTIKDIYDMITKMFPYYQENRLHWKNSVRHNLTVFSCFQRVAAEDGNTSKGSFLWKLVGDWQTVLNKAEAASSRKERLGSVESNICDSRRDRPPKSARKDKSKHRDKEQRRKKRDKAKKLKLKASYLHSSARVPLAEFNFCSPVKEERPLPARMPTPPPKLPGVENVFLPTPLTPSISPEDRGLDAYSWDNSPDLHGIAMSHFSFDDVTNLNLNYDKSHGLTHDYAVSNSSSRELSSVSSMYETDVEGFVVDGLPAWYTHYTPDPSPAKSSSDWANMSVTGYTPPSTNTALWDLVDPEVDGMMGLLTLDTEWMASIAEDDFQFEL